MTTTMPAAGGAPLGGTGAAARCDEAQGRSAARERNAFDAALERQAQAAPPTGARHAGADRATPARPGAAGPGAAGDRVAGRGSAADGLAERGAAPPGANGPADGPADHQPRGRGTDAAEREPEPAPPSTDPALAALRRRGRQHDLPDEAPASRWSDPPAALAIAMPPPSLAAAVSPLAAAPRSLAAEAPPATAARRATLAEMAAAPTGAPQRWQVQLTEPALPVRGLLIERAAAGPLTLVVSTSPAVPAHQADRLRRQLAARGAEPLLRSTADSLDEDLPR